MIYITPFIELMSDVATKGVVYFRQAIIMPSVK